MTRDETTVFKAAAQDAPDRNGARKRVREHIVEIVSDSGEGAQKAGQTFGTVSAKMGNGVWTVEIIPAEIKPPARSRAGASGIRVRLGSTYMTNMGDEADLVVAFNEQVPYGRIESGAFKPGTIILLESKWSRDPVEEIRKQYADALADFRAKGYVVKEMALEEEVLKTDPAARVGKNMFVLGMLCEIYGRDLEKAMAEVQIVFGRKGEKVVQANQRLVEAGFEYARGNLDLHYEVPAMKNDQPLVVMNGNQAAGLGIMAAGMEVAAMYPITPATSVSHYLGGALARTGGVLHQAEDEIAAIGFALGASYAGKTACTITSGPGLALKTEFVGLAVMAELPLVLLVVQRGGPSTGLPTKVEQGDLLAALYGAPGDSPKVIMAPATIEECFHFMVTARKIAEEFRTPVLVLTDANLATGVQPFPRPRVSAEWLAPPIDQSPWQEGVAAYDWDEETGLSPRPIPGQPGGEYVLTGLAHTRASKVAYDTVSNQLGCDMRSRKLATLGRALKPPKVHGADEGDLLVVSWGSTEGAIVEAVDRMREDGHKVANVHLRFLSPLEPGLAGIFSRFKKVMTLEINYSDDPEAPGVTSENRRTGQLALILRERTLIDIDCWSIVPGHPIPPGRIVEEVTKRLSAVRGEATCSA